MIVPDQIEEYAAGHTTPPTELLQALAAETRETLRAPQMLTGTIEGRFLEMSADAFLSIIGDLPDLSRRLHRYAQYAADVGAQSAACTR